MGAADGKAGREARVPPEEDGQAGSQGINRRNGKTGREARVPLEKWYLLWMPGLSKAGPPTVEVEQ